jgi:hypothetical protein
VEVSFNGACSCFWLEDPMPVPESSLRPAPARTKGTAPLVLRAGEPSVAAALRVDDEGPAGPVWQGSEFHKSIKRRSW